MLSFNSGKRFIRLIVTCLCLLLLHGLVAKEDHEKVIRLLQDREAEEKLIRDLIVTITKAAHPTSESPGLRKYKITEPREDRIKLFIEIQYRGVVTGNLYFGEVVVVVDRKDKEVIKLEFSDLNNTIAPNGKNLRRIRSKIDKLMEKHLK